MTERAAFEYAVLQAFPDLERGESMNVGILLWCHARDFLGAIVEVDRRRLRALAAHADEAAICEAVEAVKAALEARTGTGPAAEMSKGERFRWLTAPRSTVVQPGPVHAGLTSDPAAELVRLAERLVKAR